MSAGYLAFAGAIVTFMNKPDWNWLPETPLDFTVPGRFGMLWRRYKNSQHNNGRYSTILSTDIMTTKDDN